MTFLLPPHTLMPFPPCLPALVGSSQKFLPLCLQGESGGISLPLSAALTALQEPSGGGGGLVAEDGRIAASQKTPRAVPATLFPPL